jgi:uncharacterized membrane protein
MRATTIGLWLGGGVALGVLTALDYPLVGVGVVAAAALASFALQYNYEGVLFDERDRTYDRLAAARTLQVFGMASAGVFPTLTVLWGVGYFEWSEWSVTLAFAVAVLYGTYGAMRFAMEWTR